MRRLLLSACLGAGLTTVAARAADKITPSWMKIDAGEQSVALEIIAGWNPDNSSLNYNGFHDGQMTVVVPVGWKVSIHFTNHDGDLPHSLLVTKPYDPGSFPDVAGQDQVAIPRAYSRSPDTGIDSNTDDTIEFTAKEPGPYYFFCGAQGHAKAGMWDHFEVSADATEPYVTLADGVTNGFR
jgi:sulfocyanin